MPLSCPKYQIYTTCDNCWREFVAMKFHWRCPWCGHHQRCNRYVANTGFKRKIKGRTVRCGPAIYKELPNVVAQGSNHWWVWYIDYDFLQRHPSFHTIIIRESEADMTFDEITEVSRRSMTMLPPAPDVCQLCARKHERDGAHDALSLFYCMRFQLMYGRSPTWADAIHHLSNNLRSLWRVALDEHNAWTEPDGHLIAETPYVKDEAESTVAPALDGRYPPYLVRR